MAHTIHPIIHLVSHHIFPLVQHLVPCLSLSTPLEKKVYAMFYIKIIEKFNAVLSVSALHNNSVPLQAQHQTTVMPLWCMNRGISAHHLLSHYLLNHGKGVQTKALSTNPRVSIPTILLRQVLTKGNFILHLYYFKSKVSFVFVLFLKKDIV